MRYAITLCVLGAAWLAYGLLQGGWFLIAAWLGTNFLLLGIAHAKCWHAVFGKGMDGTLPLWSWLLFLPLHLLTYIAWRAVFMLTRAPATSEVTPQLVVGRRLLASEFANLADRGVANVVDLTAEFQEPSVIRQHSAYRPLPILDGSAPDARSMYGFVQSLRPGLTYIHCAQGHGRTALVAAAFMITSGIASDEVEATKMLKTVRPRVRLNRCQRACLREYLQLRG